MLFAYYCCLSEKQSAYLLVEHMATKTILKDPECIEGQIDKTAAWETLSLLFQITSTFMLVSLVQLSYMEELYKPEEYQKLSDAIGILCERFL